jgi:hypothetical protein
MRGAVGLLVTIAACHDAHPGTDARAIVPSDDAPLADAGDPACVIEHVVEVASAGTTPRDCGHLPIGTIDGPFVVAHDCVVAAAAAHEDFVVLWDIQGVDSRVANAYLGRTTSAGWAITAFFYDDFGTPEPRPSTTTSTCAQLDDLGACGQVQRSLCLACADQNTIATCPP